VTQDSSKHKSRKADVRTSAEKIKIGLNLETNKPITTRPSSCVRKLVRAKTRQQDEDDQRLDRLYDGECVHMRNVCQYGPQVEFGGGDRGGKGCRAKQGNNQACGLCSRGQVTHEFSLGQEGLTKLRAQFVAATHPRQSGKALRLAAAYRQRVIQVVGQQRVTRQSAAVDKR
jgi:hypothetical protein